MSLATQPVPPLGTLTQEEWEWLVQFRYQDWLETQTQQKQLAARYQLESEQLTRRRARRDEVIEYVRSLHAVTSKVVWGWDEPPKHPPDPAAVVAAEAVWRELKADGNEDLYAVFMAFYDHTQDEEWTEAQQQDQQIEQQEALDHLLNNEGLEPFVDIVEPDDEPDYSEEEPLTYDPDDDFDDKLAQGYAPWDEPEAINGDDMPADQSQYAVLIAHCSQAQQAYLQAIASGQSAITA